MFPFKEIFVKECEEYIEVIREFKKETSDFELNWHRDKEDRIISVIEGKGWYIQLENELPKELLIGVEYKISNNIWHRVINKNRSNLKIKVKKRKHK